MPTLVLVVEDDENSRLLQQAMLTSQGYEVLSAAHGKEAVELLHSHDVDLIISDILMPEMDGYALCRYCKSDPRYKNIPFVFYTATYTNPEDEQHALDVGASKFIVKPMEVDDFLREIRIVLEQYRENRLEVKSEVAKPRNELNADYSTILGKKLEKKVQEVNLERRRAEVSEETYRKLVEFATIGIMRISPDGRLETVNERMSEILGYASPEDMQARCEDCVQNVFFDPQDRKRLIDKLGERGELRNEECVFRRADGSALWVEVSSRVLLDEAGKVVCYEDFVSDISVRKRAEKSLLDAKESAEEASNAKSAFLANMSHEIRTPLNGLVGMLRLMETTGLSAEQQKYIDIALLSSKRLTRLLSDILDISTVEAGKMSIIMEPFDLKDAIDSVFQLFSPVAMEKGLDLLVHFNPEIPASIIGDTTRLQQVLNNLVGNAIKFTSEGRVEIEAHPLPSGKEGEYRVLFSVSDTGIGMSDALIQRLFTPFTQAEGSYRRKFQGAGLGLAISKRIVEFMGGALAVVSEEGEGATFYFSIPFKKAASETPQPKRRLQEPVATGLQLLLADDSVFSRIAIGKQLEKLGHHVMEVNDGEKALAKLREKPFDLVFMDVQMPILDGVEATKAIRKGDAGAENMNIPIIAITAYAMTGDRDTFLDAGMDGYVAKPVEIEDIQEEMNKVLAARQ